MPTVPNRNSGEGSSGLEDLVPRPDPTKLTQQASERLEETLRRELHWVEAAIGARLDAMDQATTLRLGAVEHIPQMIKDEVTHLDLFISEKIKGVQSEYSEKFIAIGQQFTERDQRSEQLKKAADDALAAALQAAKELVGVQAQAAADAATKAETSFTAQIAQQSTQIETVRTGLDARLTEVKERIDRGEGQEKGTSVAEALARTDLGLSHQSRGNSLQGIGIAIGLFGVLLAVTVTILLTKIH